LNRGGVSRSPRKGREQPAHSITRDASRGLPGEERSATSARGAVGIGCPCRFVVGFKRQDIDQNILGLDHFPIQSKPGQIINSV
jgi:hypothetical protein